ncbi:MAG TPA: hypothetical protein VGI80_08750 [Pyrinomonadaceae bacterium]|jgi:hypothetical protein
MTPEIQFNRGAISAGECVSTAWEMVKSKYGMYLGISLIAMLMTSCIPCLNIFLLGPVMGGIFYVGLRDMKGEPVDFGMMFKGFENFVPLMVIGLIQSIPGVISQVVQYGVRFGQLASGGARRGGATFYQGTSIGPDVIAGVGVVVILIVVGVFLVFAFVWWAIFFFAIPLAMDRRLPVLEAIKLSARAAMGNVGGLLVLMILEVLVVLLGMLLLCVGIFLISLPVIFLTNVVVYRMVFPPEQSSPFNFNPPDPGMYRDFGPGGMAA